MTAASKGVLCARAYTGEDTTYLIFSVSYRCCCVLFVCQCGVHFGVFCAVWWRAAVTRLGSDTRCKTLQLQRTAVHNHLHLITVLRFYYCVCSSPTRTAVLCLKRSHPRWPNPARKHRLQRVYSYASPLPRTDQSNAAAKRLTPARSRACVSGVMAPKTR